MKVIETKYKGYLFRSRLEARWAVFFDACGIRWEYEPEGIILSDGSWYLPDFYLPDFYCYFEVKRNSAKGTDEGERLSGKYQTVSGPMIGRVSSPLAILWTMTFIFSVKKVTTAVPAATITP